MALPFLTPFTNWLTATPLSTMMGEVSWMIPAVQSAHIMAIAVLAGAALMVDLRLLGAFGEGESIPAFTRRYLPWLWWALLGLLLTGALMIAAEPHRALQNTTFVLKMAMVLVAAALTALIQAPLKADAGFWQGRKTLGRLFAVASLCIWTAIVFCGRWIAYSQDVQP